MARYIDADKAKGEMKFGKGDFILWKGKTYVDISIIEKVILNATTADVVPKSEVDRWRFQLEAVLEEIPETKREVAREIFEEIDRGIAEQYPIYSAESIRKLLAELKKEYTGETK